MRTDNDSARILLAKALQIDLNLPNLPKLPKTYLQQSDLLTDQDVELAVESLKLCLDLPSGNSGGRDLYRLLKTYLRDSEARAEINKILSTAKHSY